MLDLVKKFTDKRLDLLITPPHSNYAVVMKLLTQLISRGQSIAPEGRALIRILALCLILFMVLPALVKKVLLTDVSPLKDIMYTTYGPSPEYLPSTDSSYNFFSVKNSFGKVDLERVGEIHKNNLEDLILSSLDLELRKRLRPHLSETLEISQKYKLDPYWVLAIMWTESHYVHSARSNKNAHGLMQVLPSTAKTLYEDDSVEEILSDPSKNIEVGALYLRRLLDLYSNNYQVATVAYNQGPGNIKKKGKKVMVNNQYLLKVRSAYKVLTVKTNDYFSKVSPPFEKSFIARNDWMKKYIKRIISIFPKASNQRLVYSPIKTDKKKQNFYL